MRTYLTVAIPYVNADPHLGYAFELVEADLAARARRSLGQSVRFLGGTDEYSLKNVIAAAAAGETTSAFVDRHADEFAALAEPLGITFDDFIRTSRDPRHRPAVERLWRACAAVAICTSASTRGRIAWAVSSSTRPKSSSMAAAPSTTRRWTPWPRPTGSSASRPTPTA